MDISQGNGLVPADQINTLFRRAREESSNPTGATEGVRGALNKVGFRLPPGPAESQARERTAALATAQAIILQTTFTRSVGVLVANPKGTSGKTPTTLMLAAAIATIKGSGICALEVADDSGTLSQRAEGDPRLGLGSLVAEIDQVKSAGQLSGYAVPQTSFVDVFGSLPSGRRPALTAEAVLAVSQVIDDYYRFRVMDSGNVVSTGPFLGAVDVADVLVVPVMMAGDSGLKAIEMLDYLTSHGGHAAELAANAVVLRMADGRPEDPRIRAEVINMLEQRGVTRQFDIAFDAHIAERGELTWSRLSEQTRESFTLAAASVIRVLQGEKPSEPIVTSATSPNPAPVETAADADQQEDEVEEEALSAPVSAAQAAGPVLVTGVVAAPADTADSLVECPTCHERVPEALFCTRCGSQLAVELDLDRLYPGGSHAAGYAEPASSLPDQLLPASTPPRRRAGGDTSSSASA